MSCPDWRLAAAWRAGEGAAPAGWQARLEHLAGCPSCRRRVAALDPALLLAAAAALPAPPVGADEARLMRSTVRSLVAAERLAGRRRPERRPLAAAAALVALLAVPLGVARLGSRPSVPPPPEQAATRPEPAVAPPVEEVLPADARIYQFGTEELPVVFIFDENLDL